MNKSEKSIQHKNADASIFQRYLSTKFQGSEKRFFEIRHCYILDYTFAQSQFFQWKR